MWSPPNLAHGPLLSARRTRLAPSSLCYWAGCFGGGAESIANRWHCSQDSDRSPIYRPPLPPFHLTPPFSYIPPTVLYPSVSPPTPPVWLTLERWPRTGPEAMFHALEPSVQGNSWWHLQRGPQKAVESVQSCHLLFFFPCFTHSLLLCLTRCLSNPSHPPRSFSFHSLWSCLSIPLCLWCPLYLLRAGPLSEAVIGNQTHLNRML